MPMTAEAILEAMEALITVAREDEDRPLTDDEAERYEALESQLQAVQRSAQIAARDVAYRSAVHPGIHVATAQHDDTLDRAFDSYLRTGQQNQDLVELRAQGEAVGSEGGFLVPPGFRDVLIERMLAFGGLANEVETLSTSTGQSLEWPTNDDTANAGEIVAEGGTFASGADLVFGTATLGAYKYGAGGASNVPVRVSMELLQDSAFDVAGFLARALGTRIGRAQAVHWVRGTGTGQPLGILTTTTNESVDVSLVVDFDDLTDTMARLDPDYISNAVWAFNNATLWQIRQLVDGQSRPLWLPNAESGMTDLPGGTLLGHRVVIDQAFNSVAANTNRIAVFGDLRQAYVIRRVLDVTVIVDPFTRAANGQTQFHAWARADGTIQQRNAYVTLANIA